MRRLVLARHLAARYPALAVGPLLLVGVLGWLLLPAPAAYQSVAADPSGQLQVQPGGEGQAFRDASGVRFSLPAQARVRQVKRPDPTPATAVRVEFAWGQDCPDDRCVQPGGFLQYGTMAGVTGQWYRDQVRHFGSHEAYVRYAYYRPVGKRPAYFSELHLEPANIGGAAAWTIRYAEPRRDQPRRWWEYWQVTDSHYLNLSFVAPIDDAAPMQQAVQRVVDSVRAP